VLAPHGYDWQPDELGGQSVGDALLAIHRPYLDEVAALEAAGVGLKALAHITGGGLLDNLPRVLPEGVGALVRHETWDIPPIFELLVRLGGLDEREAFHALNMGIGMLAIIPAEQGQAALRAVPEARLVGELAPGSAVQLV
jgi:phosphoribosylformylglycinamidine cyclo-ligase